MNFFFFLGGFLLFGLLLIPIITLPIFTLYLISLNVVIPSRIYNLIEILFYINRLFST